MLVFPTYYKDADVSKVLPGNIRYVVYVKAPPTEKGLPLQSLRLQKIDALSGAKIEDPVVLIKDIELGSDVKVDPKGRFVLFTDFTDTKDGLYYLALDATGHSSGKPRKLVSGGDPGFVDLLPEQ